MTLTIVASLCQVLAAATTGASAPNVEPSLIQLCHEEIVLRADMPLQACFNIWPGVADWKMKSRFRDDEWTIGEVRCEPGFYLRKEQL